ncbi:hypothetical protein [Flavobacterium poyangense]|uniref:hypothetical protein n=1 Tax=Flavobacterium poyangense TaxID=2204302 RepID=UPI00141D9B7F|nr:hypothetical protein [Flavobacterium sp. JXAS1]
MKTTDVTKKQLPQVNSTAADTELQKLYTERIERFMALVELSYALKHAPKIIKKK